MELHRVTEITIADVPEDGGKWAIYCEHFDNVGEIIYTGVLQDTNKRRLSQWIKHSNEWCNMCSGNEVQ